MEPFEFDTHRAPQSRAGKRNGKRFRRARHRGRMTPAEALRLSTRTRRKGWFQTKSITRFHRRKWYWSDQWSSEQ